MPNPCSGYPSPWPCNTRKQLRSRKSHKHSLTPKLRNSCINSYSILPNQCSVAPCPNSMFQWTTRRARLFGSNMPHSTVQWHLCTAVHFANEATFPKSRAHMHALMQLFNLLRLVHSMHASIQYFNVLCLSVQCSTTRAFDARLNRIFRCSTTCSLSCALCLEYGCSMLYDSCTNALVD